MLLPADWRSWSLARMYEALPNDECDGCDGCGEKCAGEIRMTRWEYEQIRTRDPVRPPNPPREKAEPFAQPCAFRDVVGGRCVVYPARPLICRLFGLVEWLPCPLERWPTRLPQGLEIVRWYAREQLRTYAQWAALLPDREAAGPTATRCT
ncbi:MAG: YkgJ family cysteine cluster protein [Armatimonadota bacterium]